MCLEREEGQIYGEQCTRDALGLREVVGIMADPPKAAKLPCI